MMNLANYRQPFVNYFSIMRKIPLMLVLTMEMYVVNPEVLTWNQRFFSSEWTESFH